MSPLRHGSPAVFELNRQLREPADCAAATLETTGQHSSRMARSYN